MLRIFFLLLSSSGLSGASEPILDWTKLKPIPNATGVAGAFAGVIGPTLIVAGGANFPEKMPWEGGPKVWHDAIFALELPDGRWTQAGRLPAPRAYGVSVSDGDSVICVGGSDSDRHYAETLRIRLHNQKATIDELPPLPLRLANMSGARVSGMLYVAGGTEEPGERKASGRLFALDLLNPNEGWRELEPIPGRPRLLSVAAAHNGDFYLFGGVALEPKADGRVGRVYLKETLMYRAGEGWARKSNLPGPIAASPSPAPVVQGRAFVLGGDDGTRVSFEPLEKHPGFNKSVLTYDFKRDSWSTVGSAPVSAVTTPSVKWNGTFIIPSGEVRPGVRSADTWRISIH